MIVNGNLKFHTLGAGELQNAVIENLTTVARNLLGNVAGHMVYDTDLGTFFYNNGAVWVAFSVGGDISGLQSEINAIETASGGIFDTDGTYVAATLDAGANIAASTDLADAILQLDAAITGTNSLAELEDTVATTTSGAIDGDLLAFNGTNWDNTGFASLAANDLLQWNGTDWTNVVPSSIGGNAYETFLTDVGTSIVADSIADTASLLGATNGGIQTTAAADAVTFDLTPVDLATTAAAIVAGDFLIVSDSLDAAGTTAKKMTITQMITGVDLVTATADGILTRTAADTYASRAIAASVVAGDQGISLVSGNGVAGNPTVGLDILGLTAEAGTPGATDVLAMYDGVNNVKVSITQLNAALTAVGTSIDDLTDVTITAAANNEFLVNNGAGQWVDTTAADARTAMDVYSTGTADSTFVDLSGDTMTGNLNMGGTFIVTGLAAPSGTTDATNKLYVDNLIAGMSWKNPVVAATTASIADLSAGPLTVDGITLVAGDRVLVKDTASLDGVVGLDAKYNGIYTVGTIGADSGTWIRVTDMDSTSPIDEFNGAATFVLGGTANADIAYNMTSAVVTVDTDAVTWVPFSGTSAIVDGVGLVLTGNVLDVQLGAGIAALPSDEVGVDLFTDGGLRLSDTVGGAASTLTGAKLRVLLDGSTLTMSATGVKVSSGGITATEVNSSIAGDGLQGGSGTVLSLDLKAASGLVFDTGELSLSGIPNTALTNNSLTVAADTGVSEDAALGETVTIAGGTGIATVVSATNTVTVNLSSVIDNLTDVDTTSTAPVSGDALIWDGANWVPGEAANHATNDLTDVLALATVAGQVMVADGSGDYTPRQIQFVDTQASATTWTVTHSLNQKFVNVTIYDNADNVIIPQSIVATSASVTTVTFNTALAGTAVVMGAYGLAAV